MVATTLYGPTPTNAVIVETGGALRFGSEFNASAAPQAALDAMATLDLIRDALGIDFEAGLEE